MSMTRDEFVDAYMKGRGIDPALRTANGFKQPGYATRFVARCHCGEPDCEGWTMEYADDDPAVLKLRAQRRARGLVAPKRSEGG